MRGRARTSGRSIGVALLATAMLAAAACGGGDDGEAVATTVGAAPTTTEAAETTTTEAVDDGQVTSIEDAKGAIVQVLATGTFRDPAEGSSGFFGSGSGFIIDPSGIVVTNNHVVTGAGAIEVRIGGSTDEVPARILGVSECSDLAVLQLTDPGPYPYLQWFEDEVQPPLEIFVAGFPLGDPEYTITRGVVSKAEADGNTSWASIRHTIEYDANTQPGNSGGPVLVQEGAVVAVHYAGGDPGTGTNQFFGIASDLAGPLVEQLREGNVESIGVNGQAIASEDGSFAGVWVGGVAAGSPAAQAGVLPGDIITSLNGVNMGNTPWSMESYCDVLRSANPGAAIAVEVIRYDTQEVWAGEINGTPMTARFSFAEELGGEVEDTGGSYSYETVNDDTGAITVSVPVEWNQRDTTPTDLGFGDLSPTIIASPNLDSFLNSYDAPGMLFFYVPGGAGDNNALLDQLADPSCTEESRSDYDDSAFIGRQLTMSCPGGALLVVVAGSPVWDPAQTVVLGVQVLTTADLEALDQILYTFNIL